MSTHSKKEKKTSDKNSTTKSYTNKSEKLRGWDAIKNEPVGPYLRKMRKASKAASAKRKMDILLTLNNKSVLFQAYPSRGAGSFSLNYRN